MRKVSVVLAAVFLLFIVTIIILADQGRLPGFITSLYDFPTGDKVGHFLLMGGLSLLINMALPARAYRQHVLAIFLVSVLVALEEASQSRFGTRHLDLIDLVASLLGIFILGGLGWWLNGILWRRSRPGI